MKNLDYYQPTKFVGKFSINSKCNRFYRK